MMLIGSCGQRQRHGNSKGSWNYVNLKDVNRSIEYHSDIIKRKLARLWQVIKDNQELWSYIKETMINNKCKHVEIKYSSYNKYYKVKGAHVAKVILAKKEIRTMIEDFIQFANNEYDDCYDRTYKYGIVIIFNVGYYPEPEDLEDAKWLESANVYASE